MIDDAAWSSHEPKPGDDRPEMEKPEPVAPQDDDASLGSAPSGSSEPGRAEGGKAAPAPIDQSVGQPKPPPLSADSLKPGISLPQRVDEIDLGATRVTASAYTPPAHRPEASPTPPALPPLRRPAQDETAPSPSSGATPRPDPGAPRPAPTNLARPAATRPQDSQPPQSQAARTAPLPPLQRPGPTQSVRTAPPRTGAPAAPRTTTQPGAVYAPPKSTPPQPQSAGRGAGYDLRQPLGCVLRMFLLSLVFLVLAMIVGGSIILYVYYDVSRQLPSVAGLREKASTFETTRILDRNGNLLYEILDPNAGRRTYVPLERISPYLIAATIATEDKNYYTHPGFDPLAILRAFWQNTGGGETVSGASTITQQLARTLLFTPEERISRTYMRKVREALLAAEITRVYSKDDILELYLNEIYYGNLAYGVEAAAETHFNTTADKLTLSQAAFLAGLPQAPSVYDIYQNRDAALGRLQQVLTLMFETSRDQNCIYVSNNPQPICLDENGALLAYNEILGYQFDSPDIQMRYPHWVVYVRSLLEAQYDPQTIYRSGFSVYTTLDPGLQESAESIVHDQIAALAANNANDAALVAIRPATGEILAMVGSADFYNDAIDGQVNMAINPRQPGSTIKPVTYLAAFEKGWTPATLIWDVPSDFTPSGNPYDPRGLSYHPVNYDGLYHGPQTLRFALANSYNVPAVKALEFVGIYDNPDTPNPDGMIAMARRLGITTLTQPDYGLSLTLGGGDVSLLELTSAYGVIANSGLRLPPVAITMIKDFEGNTVYQVTPPQPEQVIRAEHAFLMSSILSDNEARSPMFGRSSVLALPFLAAAKTGTTNDFKDNWTLGYTPDLAVGVWVGNADNAPMIDTTGLTGAAPIWARFMEVAVPAVGGPTAFFRPATIVDKVICAVSGTEPSGWCPQQRGEYFASDQLPLPKEQDMWAEVLLDTWTNLRASPACGNSTKQQSVLNISDAWAIKWITENANGREWAAQMKFTEPYIFAPPRECQSGDPRPTLALTTPMEGQSITTSPLEFTGSVDAPGDFKNFTLDYGQGNKPDNWIRLLDSPQPITAGEKMYTWQLSDLPAGEVTVRLTINSLRGTYAELIVHLNLQVLTPTPTETPTATPSPTSTPTQQPTLTPTPTLLPTDPPTPTLLPTIPPTLTETPGGLSPTATPTSETEPTAVP